MRSLASRATPAVALCCLSLSLHGQQAPENGPRTVHTGWHALTNATAVTRPGTTIANATVVLRRGRIVSVAAGTKPPAGARVWDCKGLTVYAGFVEPYVSVDAPAPDQEAPGTHWNPKITPQRHVLQGEGLPVKEREELRGLGFGAVAIAPKGGILRGTAAIVLTGEPGAGEGERVVVDHAFQTIAFDRSSGYPGSEMGVLAALRQAFLDADWHAQCVAVFRLDKAAHREPEQADALDALARHRNVPHVFDTSDELQLLRAHRIAGEFELKPIAVGSGLEFRRIDAVAATGMPIVLPVDFPKAPDVSNLAKAERVSLRDLATWEQAPTNARRLKDKGVKVAFTTARLEKRSDFFAGVRRAIAAGGLSKDDALGMLTVEPAGILGVGDRLGAIAKGMIANLVVVEGDLFGQESGDEKAKIRSVWVEGRHFVVSRKKHDMDGRWQIAASVGNKRKVEVHVDGEKVSVVTGDKRIKAKRIQRKDRHLTFVVDGEPFGVEGQLAMGGHVEPRGFFGRGYTPDGALFRFVGTRVGDLDPKQKGDGKKRDKTGEKGSELESVEIVPLALPFGAYGLAEPPRQERLLITGATVWTSGPQGTIENGALLLRDGKVEWVGKADEIPDDLPAGVRRIDAAGKHVTPGLIDCHSHTGISRGVNESRQTVTSEVRIADVVNPDDIAWYRELAGGLTAVNQLHGSANPIGGQNHVAKIRWGCRHPDDMSLRGAPSGIKFALGENPKRRGEDGRYPGSRLGVAALIRDRFVAAREYDAARRAVQAMDASTRSKRMPLRRDLELEAIAEIIRGERLVHCHSYRQDEIFMLCKLADEFGFKIGTFQHVLEGYKVAEAVKKSALGASSFSDWWAYKLEVFDAIPFNGAIMHEVGVVVSFNSDSSELARRMNTEAGKAVKYGGVSPAEALKFVTLNPAIQLGVQDRIGSLEKGKDADFAIWTGDPLSYRSRCEATYIDGRPYFTILRDRELRAIAKRERQRLLQKALRAEDVVKPAGGPRRRVSRYGYIDELYSCCEEVR